jgi:hypothetical protein
MAITVKIANDWARWTGRARPQARAPGRARAGRRGDGGQRAREEGAGEARLGLEPEPIPVAVRPNSNTPLMLSANASIAAASPKTNAGDWSWNPQPSWLPPARRTARIARQHPERDEDARGEDEPVERDLAAVGPGLVHESEDLDPEHGKDARHQVEDEAADEGEEERAQEAAGLRGGRHPTAAAVPPQSGRPRKGRPP